MTSVFSADELRLIASGQQQLASVDTSNLQAFAERHAQPTARVDVLRTEAVRRELAAREGTPEEQVLRHVAASRVLSVKSYSATGIDGYSHQVRNSRYPDTEHSAGLNYDSQADRWTNASGLTIPAGHVLTYLRAYEEDPTYNPMSRLQEITGLRLSPHSRGASR